MKFRKIPEFNMISISCCPLSTSKKSENSMIYDRNPQNPQGAARKYLTKKKIYSEK
jgi:hypothetical protein